MSYIRCSSTFTKVQEAFLERLAKDTSLFSLDDIVTYKRSCCDVAEVQRLVDFLYVYSATSELDLQTLLQEDGKFSHLAIELRDLLTGNK